MIKRSGMALVAGLLATVAASPVDAQTPQRGGALTIGVPNGIPTFDVMASTDDTGRVIHLHMYEPLIGRNEKLEAAPMLAESWSVSADGLTYTFKIRKGIVFHNGKVLTSADAKASIERYMRMSVRRRYLEDVAEVSAPDADTVALKLKSARPLFMNNFSQPEVIVAMLPAEEAAKDANKIESIGTGPYKLQEYRPDSHVRLVRHDAYVADTRSAGRDGYVGNKQAYLDTLTFRIIPESSSMISALEAGELDMAEWVPDKAVPNLKKNTKLVHVNIMPAGMQSVSINIAQAPMNNLSIRRAVEAAIDVDEIMEAARDGNYTLNHAVQYPGYATYPGDRNKGGYNKKDPALAKKLLAEGGYKGEPITILSAVTFDWHAATALVMSEQLKAVGMNVQLSSMDWPAIVALRSRPQGWHLNPGFFGTGPWLGDPLISIASLIGPIPGNHFKDEPLYGFARDMENLPTAEGRLAAWFKAQDRIIDQVLMLKLGDIGHSQMLSTKIKGFEKFRTARMWNVWVQN
jgi:peptide/nickel transport system substrate-binding protein